MMRCRILQAKDAPYRFRLKCLHREFRALRRIAGTR